MLPIILDVATVRCAIAGEGAQALGRIRFLKAHGAAPVAVFAPEPDEALRAEAGAVLVDHWPKAEELRDIHVLFASDLEPARAQAVATAARQTKTLLNTEDATALCDFHVPAAMRRGDLLLTVSTGGKAPGLSRRLAAWLSEAVGPEWEARLAELADRRAQWRAAGLRGPQLAVETDKLLAEKGWLPKKGWLQ